MKVEYLAAGVVAGFLVLAVIDWRFDGRIDRLEEAMGFTQEDESHNDHLSGRSQYRKREYSSQENYSTCSEGVYFSAPYQEEYYSTHPEFSSNSNCRCFRW